MPPEPDSILRLWHPLGFFQEFQDKGLLIFGLTALAFLAAAAFLVLTARRRARLFFSLPLFLALAPFIFCSLISGLEFYLILRMAPPGTLLADFAPEIVRIPYAFQFGLVVSGSLLSIHLFAFAFLRRRSGSDPGSKALA